MLEEEERERVDCVVGKDGFVVGLVIARSGPRWTNSCTFFGTPNLRFFLITHKLSGMTDHWVSLFTFKCSQSEPNLFLSRHNMLLASNNVGGTKKCRKKDWLGRGLKITHTRSLYF